MDMKNITPIAFLLLFGFFLNAANATMVSNKATIIDISTSNRYEFINPDSIAGGGVKDNRTVTLIESPGGITQPSIPSSIADYNMLLKAPTEMVTSETLEKSKLIAVRDTCAYLALQNFNAIIDSDLSIVTDGEYKHIQEKVFNEIMVNYKKEGTNGESPFTESEITLMTTTITTTVKELKPFFIYDPRSPNVVVKPTLPQIINVTNNTLGFTTPPLTFDINHGQTTPINSSNLCVSTNMNLSSQTNLTQLPGYSGSPVNPYNYNLMHLLKVLWEDK